VRQLVFSLTVTIGTVDVGVSVMVSVGTGVNVVVGDGIEVGVSVGPVTGTSTSTWDVTEASGSAATIGGPPAGKLQARVAANRTIKTGKSFLLIMRISFLAGLTN
jgi:hypothetical protein